jgi:hypothetical protein
MQIDQNGKKRFSLISLFRCASKELLKRGVTRQAKMVLQRFHSLRCYALAAE